MNETFEPPPDSVPDEPPADTVPDEIPVLDGMAHDPTRPEVIVITGMSGAGRTRAAAVLEDLGWYVVDNLPPEMISPLAGMMARTAGGVQRLAVVVDVRSRHFFDTLIDALADLRDQGMEYRLVFLDASDETLIRRYEQVRRPHPLQYEGRILDGIQAERQLLANLRERADELVDTSTTSVYDLVRTITQMAVGGDAEKLSITIVSFGFKYGLPLDADHVVDVRFLANPYWVSELRHLTGRDDPVRDYVMNLPGARAFVERYVEALEPAFAGYVREHKRYITLAVGCTGGKHRSVAIAEAIASAIRERGRQVRTVHRDVGKE